MVTASEKKKMINAFEKYDNLSFLEVIKKVDSTQITFSELKFLHDEWKNDYVKYRSDFKNYTLEDFIKILQSHEFKDMTTENILTALYMRMLHCPVSYIAKRVNIKEYRLYNLYINAKLYGIFSGVGRGKIDFSKVTFDKIKDMLLKKKEC